MTTQRWTDASGVRIHYLDNDPSPSVGLPIVFSPGVVDDADDYEAMLPFFSPRRVLVVDVRGRGKSEAPPHGYSVDHLADDLDAAVGDAGLEHFHLMTFSRGTPTAFRVALRHPERVVSISIGDYQAVEIALAPSFVDRQWGLSWRGRPMAERVQRHVLEGIQRDSRAREHWNDLDALGIPVLLAYGTGPGTIVNEETVARYRRSIARTEIVTIPDAGHDLFRPDRLAYPRTVAGFVARVEG
ncbi:MAG TPA: alpha/beta fold hydrolase [Acidimicrobiales bacterium]|nr:alpha/beta fold hydrolase [Acidimicrobiales bacterium]